MEPLRLFILLLAILLVTEVKSARILGVYPMPSISHQVVFRSLTLELVKRGHEVVAITPDPAFKDQESPANLTEIDISESYQVLRNNARNKDVIKLMKRGIIVDFKTMNTISSDIILKHMFPMFDNPNVKELLKGEQKFDLVIVEALYYSPLIFSKIFDAPAILFSSLYGTINNYETLGAVGMHPVFYPQVYRTKFRNLSILDKFYQYLYYEWDVYKFEKENERLENEFLKSKFGKDAPTVDELKDNVALFFANSHPLFDGNRPVPPGVVYLGAMQLQPVKALPQDLKSYLDSSKRGVIYVSLGSNVRPSMMQKDLLDAFLVAFEALPFDILWKFDGDNLENAPKNVKIQKWFPQRDLLVHPNIKAFVMQGGLQSTDEAIDSEVPLIGIPVLGDQWYNINRCVQFGVAIEVDTYTMVAEDLIKAVNEVATNPSYKENMKKLKSIMQDQPQSPVERAAWWTEHVLRHKGSRHLLGPAARASWTDYLLADIVICLSIFISIIIIIVSTVLYVVVKKMLSVVKPTSKHRKSD